MSTLAQLVVKIAGDTGQLEAALGRAEHKATSMAGGIGKAFSSIGKFTAIGAVAGLGALTAAAVSFTGEAREAVKIEKQLDAVLKSTSGVAGVTAKAAMDYAGAMQRVTNFDDDAVLSAENVLLTFTKVGKDAFFPATKAALDMSTALKMDLQSAITMVGKALNDPVKGITAMTKAGVAFTDQQKDQIKALVESGDLLSAQKIILKELATEFGGSAEAAADPWTQVKNQFGELQETLGKALLPTVDRLSAKFRDFLIAHQPQIDAFAAALGEELPKAVDKFADVAQRAFDVVSPFLESLDATDITIIAAAIGGVLVAAMGAYTVATIAAMIATVGLTGGLLIAIPAIIAAVVLLVRNWESIWPKLQEAPMALLNWLKTHWTDGLVAVLTGGFGLIVKHWGDIFDAMPGPVQTAMNFVAGFVSKTINFIIGALNKLTSKLNTIKNFGGSLNPFSHTPDIPEIPGVGDFQNTAAPNTNIKDSWQMFNEGQAASVGAGWKAAAQAFEDAAAGAHGLVGGLDELNGSVDAMAASASSAAEQAMSAAEGLKAVADAFAQWQLRQLREAFLRSGLSEDEFRRRLQSPQARFLAELGRTHEQDIFRQLMVGSFAHGGVVPRDGLAAVHAGEKITRASEASAGGVVYLTVNASGEQSEASAERITRRVMRAMRDELRLKSMSGPRVPQSGYTPL